jgi:hypothetical protein
VHGRRRRDAGRSQGEAGSGRRGANHNLLAVVFDFGLGQRIEVCDDLRPGTGASERRDTVFQRPLLHQREEAAEHMAANGRAELM